MTVCIKHITEIIQGYVYASCYFCQNRLPRPGFARPKMCLKTESMIQHTSSTLIVPLTIRAKRAKKNGEYFPVNSNQGLV